jgi:predicted lipoprotein with Yx(FWY)xxD motif
MRRIIVFGVVLTGLITACGVEAETSPISGGTSTTVTVETAPTTTESGPTIVVVGVSFGGVLADDNERTMYVFERDEAGVSSCYDDCAANWPSVAVGLVAGSNIDATIGSVPRDDGDSQLTVNGRPVYLFSGDSQRGDINGQGLSDVWFVIGIDGEPITKIAGGDDDY